MDKKALTFIYSNKIYGIIPKSDLIIDSLNEFANAIKINISELKFYSKGKPLNISKSIDKYTEDNISIFVFNLKKNFSIPPSTQIICPECNKAALITISNDKISIFNCPNKHNITNIPLNEYSESQNLVENDKILCNICGNSQKIYGDRFKICTCGMKLCSLCENEHEIGHEKIEDKNKFTRCLEHGKIFLTYCLQCNMNLCPSCEEKHIKHKITYKKSIPINDNELHKMKNLYEEIKEIAKEYRIELHRVNNIIII